MRRFTSCGMIDGMNIESSDIYWQTASIDMSMNNSIDTSLTKLGGFFVCREIFPVVYVEKNIYYLSKIRRGFGIFEQDIPESFLIYLIDRIDTPLMYHLNDFRSGFGMDEQSIVDVLRKLHLTDILKHSHPFGILSHHTKSYWSTVSYLFHTRARRLYIEMQIFTGKFDNTESLF